jgi:hypothetical protein
VAKEPTGKIGVHTLFTADELVRERQARHQAPLLEPEDRCGGAREKIPLTVVKATRQSLTKIDFWSESA